MFKITLIGFMVWIASAAYSKDKVHTLKWGINLEPLHYFTPAAKHFKRQVERKTKGRVLVDIRIGEYKQNERNHVKDVQSGKYDMGQETVLNLQKIIPEFDIWNLPFLFESNSHVFSYTDSRFGKKLLAKFDGLDLRGIEYTYSGGFIDIYGEKLNSFKDLKGKSVGFEERSQSYSNFVSKVPLKIKIEEYGNLSKNTKFSEVISSTVDELVPLSPVNRKYLNITRHRVFARVLFISNSFLTKLSEQDRKIVLEESESVAIMEREMAIGMTDVFRQTLGQLGTKINYWSPGKRKEEKLRFTPMYNAYKKRFGDKAINFIEGQSRNRGVLDKVSER